MKYKIYYSLSHVVLTRSIKYFLSLPTIILLGLSLLINSSTAFAENAEFYINRGIKKANKGDLDKGQYNKPEQIGYASGTCLFTSKKTIDKLDMFDSFLFAYHDDLDLCWRAALEDIKSYYIPSSIVYHPPEGFSFKWNSGH